MQVCFTIHYKRCKKYIHFVFLSTFILLSTEVHAQKIPQDLIKSICTNHTINTGSPGNTGISNIQIPCFSPALTSYLDFYYIKILSGTTFTFLVTPNGNVDYDFVAFLNPNWDNLNATPNANKRGSGNDPFQSGVFHLGLSLTAMELCEAGGSSGFPDPGIVRYFDVKPNDEILIVIDRYSRTNLGYTLSFEGGGDAILDCTIVGDIYSICALTSDSEVYFEKEEFLKDLEIDYPDAIYKFYYDQDEAEKNGIASINFPIKSKLKVGEIQEIYVRVETKSGNFIRVVKLLLQVKPNPVLNQDVVRLPDQCTYDENGQATFDLTQANRMLIDNPQNYKFSYYGSLDDAVKGNRSIVNPESFTTKDTSIFIRIENNITDEVDINCFATARLDINVKQATKSTDTITVCDAYYWNNRTFTESGLYEATLMNAVGCDSIARLFLTIHLTSEPQIMSMETCNQFEWNNQIYDSSGQYEMIASNINGCDSLIILKLMIYPNYSDTFNVISCHEYTWPSTGKSYTESGLYRVPFKSVHGCDSLVTLSLNIYPTYNMVENVDTESAYFWPVSQETYEYSGIYEILYASEFGCDSVFILNLNIKDNSQFVFPNVIAKGGSNGFFTGYSNKGQINIRTLNVFDRWGNLIFHNENFPSNVPEEGWNGLHNGREVPSGVYIWTAIIDKRDGTSERFQGDITVLR